jgi:glycosyltransferase involved in cell wall biosynthesis
MKIVIDASGVSRQKAGVGVYARNLIENLALGNHNCEFLVIAQDDDPELDFSCRANVQMVWIPSRYFRILPLRLILEQAYLPFLLWRRKIDVVHSLHYSFPLFPVGTKRVVTIHDMTFFDMPEVHQKIKVVYFRFFIRMAVRVADALIFVSCSAQNDCLARLGRPRGNSAVIWHGKDESLQPTQNLEESDRIRKLYKLPERFVLYIGTIEPRKNIERLVQAFAKIAAEDFEIGLVISGKMGWMMETLSVTIEQLGIASRVIFTGFVSERDKPVLLSCCTLFVYPSLYEGFGLPALEALACGAPTVTSNTSSLPEVVGDAALLVDPRSTPELIAAMRSLLSNSSLRQELIERGFVQASKFTWQRTASETFEIYGSFLPSRSKR